MGPAPGELVALGLGSNLGASRTLLRHALAALAHYLQDLRIAPLYRSPAESPIRQPPYLNTVAVGTTHLSPEDLLAVAKALEWRAGRRPSARLSARPLDIDILLYGDRVIRREELHVPHPRLAERRFALQPLVDLMPEWCVGNGRSAGQLLAALPRRPAIEPVAWDELAGTLADASQ